jgi:hypothetical protein
MRSDARRHLVVKRLRGGDEQHVVAAALLRKLLRVRALAAARPA